MSCLKSMLILRIISWQDSTIVVEKKLSPYPVRAASNGKTPTRLMLAL